MKYLNAKDILPTELLIELQKYANGTLVYIPQDTTQRRCWGETSGIKSKLSKRNDEIRLKWVEGYTIGDLATRYHLSYDSIKKIVYRK